MEFFSEGAGISKTYLPYDPDQQALLPAALQEWLTDDHPAYIISDVVAQLDLSAISARYEQEERGGTPYHPRMLVKALLYGYCIVVASSRRMAQRLHEDIVFRVLAAAEQAEGEGNFNDAQSRIMPGPDGRDFLQTYNVKLRRTAPTRSSWRPAPPTRPQTKTMPWA